MNCRTRTEPWNIEMVNLVLASSRSFCFDQYLVLCIHCLRCLVIRNWNEAIKLYASAGCFVKIRWRCWSLHFQVWASTSLQVWVDTLRASSPCNLLIAKPFCSIRLLAHILPFCIFCHEILTFLRCHQVRNAYYMKALCKTLIQF